MRIDELRKQLSAATEDGEQLRLLGRNLGRWLAEFLPEGELRELGRALAAVAPPLDPFAGGYRRGLSDVLSAYLLAQADQEEEHSQQAQVLGDAAKSVLLELEAGPKRQNELHSDESKASRLLAGLRASGLVERWSGVGVDRRVKLHRLTPLGRDLLRRIRGQRSASPPSNRHEEGPAMQVTYWQRESVLIGALNPNYVSAD
ncbi:MAG: winged helix-turn-helix transcriptional regulator [Planctomycetes bacterium]|nr:winged helix-turn-helix transcriptional regulator [Planctomycetota bacterium]